MSQYLKVDSIYTMTSLVRTYPEQGMAANPSYELAGLLI